MAFIACAGVAPCWSAAYSYEILNVDRCAMRIHCLSGVTMVHLAVRTIVSADPAGSTLSTTVSAMAKPVSFSGDYVRCSSTGVLESRIADGVRARLRR